MKIYSQKQFCKLYNIFIIFVACYNCRSLNDDLSKIIKQGKKIYEYESDCEKIIEKITELLLSGDKKEENFGLFCEYQVIEKIIALTKFNIKNINIIIIKNLGLLIPSLQDKKVLFYFFSNDYMNQIILNISSTIEEQDNDYLSYYINFLKTIANKLDIDTLSLFFHRENNNFPLLDEASWFFRCQDVMIKNTSRNIFLSIIKLNYEPVIQYICDLPRITDLILLADSVKSCIIAICDKKTKNEYKKEEDGALKEMIENLTDDILFMQDIFSVGNLKINYVLTNILFNIPLKYLFNLILTKTNINIAFYILNIFFKNIKNECICNLISFVLYSSQIHIKIKEIISNQDPQEIYNLIYHNKIIFHNSYNNNLLFDEYIILVYTENFLKSLRYIKDNSKTYQEIKLASENIKSSSFEAKNYLLILQKIMTKNLRTKEEFKRIIKKMEAYHNFISRTSGINIGISKKEANYSFLKIVYDSIIAYKNTELKNNINFQDNIIKKECLYFLESKIDDEYHSAFINQIFLILQIINSDKISSELKKFLFLNKYIFNNNNNNNDKIIKKYSYSSDDEILDGTKSNFQSGKNKHKTIDTELMDGTSEFKNKDNNGYIYNDDNMRINVIKDLFGISENQTEYTSIFNNEDKLSTLILPMPVTHEEIKELNKETQLLINNQVMYYEDMNFDNINLNKLLYIYNSKIADENNLNLKSMEKCLDKIIYIILGEKKILSNLGYRLSFELVENLLASFIKNKSIIEKYTNLLREKYVQIYQQIHDKLINSKSIQNKIYKYSYQYLEQAYELNKTKFINIMDECYKNDYYYFIFGKKKEDNSNFDIYDFPTKDNETLQCLFQLLIGIYDLILVIDKFKNKDKISDINNSKLLLRNKEFPLKFLGKKVNSQTNKIHIKYSSKNINSEHFFLSIEHNYVFILDYTNEGTFNIIVKFPLRQIIVYIDRGEPRILNLSNCQKKEEIFITFDNAQIASKMKEVISNHIKQSMIMEFSAVNNFINSLKLN